jgi:hypothetical protein
MSGPPTSRNLSFARMRNRFRCLPRCAPRPGGPGKIAKRDYEYKRCGTANVFCAVEPKAGRHFTEPTPRRTAGE